MIGKSKKKKNAQKIKEYFKVRAISQNNNAYEYKFDKKDASEEYAKSIVRHTHPNYKKVYVVTDYTELEK